MGEKLGKDNSKLPYWAYFVSGNLSGICTRVICQPLDVLKIRLQLQLEKSKEGKYKNLNDAIKTIYREEGITAFWKGHMPSQYLSMIYGGVQFGTYESLYNILTNLHSTDIQQFHLINNSVDTFLSGGFAGVIATVVTFPFDLFKTRLIAQNGKNEGYKGFYKGLTPTVLQIAPYSGLYFMFFNGLRRFDQNLLSLKFNNDYHSFLNFINGATSGIFAKIIVYPLDTIKKRFQIQGFERSRQSFGRVETYQSLIECISKMKRNEGILGFYKGLSPTLIKAGLNTGLMFFFYDFICDFIRSSSNPTKY